MTKQLTVKDDEAFNLAHQIAEQTGATIDEVVLKALRDYGGTLPKVAGMTPTQRADYEALVALARETAKHKLPGATSDHSDMYDEFGLPI